MCVRVCERVFVLQALSFVSFTLTLNNINDMSVSELQSEQVHISIETIVVEIKAFKHMETRVYGSEGAGVGFPREVLFPHGTGSPW